MENHEPLSALLLRDVIRWRVIFSAVMLFRDSTSILSARNTNDAFLFSS